MGFYIKPNHRRKGFGEMFFEHLQTVLEKDGTNKMYVCPDSVTGIPFWRAMGFSDSGKLDLDGQKNIYIKFIYEEEFTVIPATSNEAVFVMKFYQQNIKILHGKPILIDEWKNALASNDGDEQNFLVCRCSVPVARLRINGMFNKDIARISMLVVSGTNQRQGIGGYAIEFSEKFVKEKGFRKIAIYITEDNIAVQNLYRKYGYTVTEYGEYMTGDGVKRMYTLIMEKIISEKQKAVLVQ